MDLEKCPDIWAGVEDRAYQVHGYVRVNWGLLKIIFRKLGLWMVSASVISLEKALFPDSEKEKDKEGCLFLGLLRERNRNIKTSILYH